MLIETHAVLHGVLHIYIYIERESSAPMHFDRDPDPLSCEDLTTLCNTLRKAAPHGVITVPNLLGALGWMVGIDGWGFVLDDDDDDDDAAADDDDDDDDAADDDDDDDASPPAKYGLV